MRLGLYPAELAEGSLAAELYGSRRVAERHRHRYEVNNRYRDQIAEAGLVFSGLSPDRNLVEYVELPRDVHPYYIATQAHPELRSRPTDPHPLFRGLVGAALERHSASELFDVDESAEPVAGAEHRSERAAARRARRRSRSSRASCVYEGRVWDVRSDTVRYGDGEIVRQYVDHPGAVGDRRDRRRRAGAADPAVPASDPPPRLGDPGGAARRRGGGAARDRAARTRGGGRPRRRRLAAARELLHDARRQRRGRSACSSPAGCQPVGHAHAREAEEADIRIEWVPLADAVTGVLEGRLRNGILAIAACCAAAERLRACRGVDPWN